MKFWAKFAFMILPALLLLGCGTSGEVQEDDAGMASSAEIDGASTSGVGVDDAASGERMDAEPIADAGFQGDPLDDPNSLLAQRVVYFDLDQSEIKDDFRDTINAHAEYLASHPDVLVTLEGHADERGTREYNIALGERRANVVQRMLLLQGVPAGQVRNVSYGEERPASLGQNEESWALNRRVELIYNR
jgi:peptidoglycan-associated lipoprotein